MNHFSFSNLPTPVQHLEHLGNKLGYPNLYIKRDDLTGLEFGGNKTRKLEYVIWDAISKNADVIVTVGGLQSNHARQTAAVCARFHIKCVLILTRGDSENPPSGNLFLNTLFGADVVLCDTTNKDETIAMVMNRIKSVGQNGYFIPLGASTSIGAYAYKNAFFELSEQHSNFDVIVLASGSGGTQAGLIHGAHCKNWQGRIYGVSILFDQQSLQGFVNPLLAEMATYDGVEAVSADKVLIDDGFLGGGYGVMGDLEKKAILVFAREEGILLDPVYTGRAAGAMMELMDKGEFNKKDRILFWHTGGTPAIFCEKYRTFLLS
jgi:D-cysteine desulfhydrase family pyridoxal phosphate-dependent enzyme